MYISFLKNEIGVQHHSTKHFGWKKITPNDMAVYHVLLTIYYHWLDGYFKSLKTYYVN